VIILAIDAFRTLFESLYFGLWYTSLSGLIPAQIGSFLTRPEFVLIPKIINVVAAVIIILLLLKRWLPREELEQNRLGVALTISEVSQRTLVDTIPDLVWLKDVEGVYLNCNEKFELFFGAKESEIIGKTDYDFNEKELADSFRMHDLKVIQTNASSVNEEWLTFADNGYHGLFETIKTPMRDAKGNIVGVLGIARDITERTNKDRELKNLVRDQNIILDNVPALIIFKDTQNNIIKITNSVAVMTGLPKNKIEGRPSIEVFPDMADKYWQDDLEVIRTGQPKFGFVEPLPIADGNTKWLLTDKIPYFEDDKVAGIIVISTDISERIEYEKQLQEKEERFRKAVTLSPFPTMIHAEDGEVILINETWKELTGYAEQDIPTIADWTEKAYGTRKEDIKEYISNLYYLDRRVEEGLYNVTTKDGRTLTWDFFSAPLGKLTDGKRLVISKAKDITEQVKGEKERRKLEARLLQAQKMESIGNLAGGIAHDFNNILSAILGFTELARDSTSSNPQLQEDLGEIYSAGLRAKELVQQIVAFSRNKEQTFYPLSVPEIVKEALGLLRSTFPASIEMTVDIDENVRPVLADPTQLHQIIMNLCTNASQAMDDKGGFLTIKLSETTLSSELLAELPSLIPGTYAQLYIEDTGTGIDPEILDSIFDPYFTTKNLGDGTGLGLAVTYGIVREMAGDILVESELGKGSIFTVFLPLVDQPLLEISIADQTEALLPGGDEHILLVDDEAPILKITSRILERHGYTVTAEENGQLALDRFKKGPQAYDLVISDVSMPKMSGDRLAREILALRPGLPVLLASGYSKTITEESVMKDSVKGLLQKPLSEKTLLNTIRQVLV
jgi:PAS domain S-box-containing protein